MLLDTSGEPLRRGIAARPDLVKPNAEELAQLTGSHDPLRAAGDARRRGAHTVIASLGPDGVLALTPDGRWRAAPPAPTCAATRPAPATSAVAGPALRAWPSGWTGPSGWPGRWPCPRRRCWPPTAGEFDAAAYAELLPRIVVEPHTPTP
ncbi:1-phosphofructokinase family hexose kinase [Streptomyces californicus]